MFEILPETKDMLLAVRASGKLMTKDYEQVLVPELVKLFKKKQKVRMLVEFADGFSGWGSTHAAFDDMKIGLEHPNDFDAIALVGAPEWIVLGMEFYSLFVRGKVKSFQLTEKQDALDWLEPNDEKSC